MPRKSKKKASQLAPLPPPPALDASSPLKDETVMSTGADPIPFDEPALIDFASQPMQQDPAPAEDPLDLPPQLSPPPSPMPEDSPAPTFNAQSPSRIRSPSPIPPPSRRSGSFARIESPPVSPLLDPNDRTPRLSSNNSRPRAYESRTGFEGYGVNPHIVACISCNDFCVITGPRGVCAKKELGLEPSNSDTFFTTLCSACENHRAFLWLRLEGGVSAPDTRLQHPETLHSSMLAAWPLYKAVRDRFGVCFDPDVRHQIATVTRAQDWWREGVLTHEKSLVLMWRFDNATGTVKERNPMPRKDEFFGGPQR